MKKQILSLVVMSFVFAVALQVRTSDSSPGHDHGAASAMKEKKVETAGDPYLLEIDPVSGKSLPAEPVLKIHDGRELRFTDEASAAAFEKNPAKYLKAIDEKIAGQQVSIYPLEACVVSGEKLGGKMGQPVNHVYRNRLVRLCCKDCVSTLEKDPAKYLGLLDKAVIEAQKKTYTAKTCVVSGEALGSMGDPIDMVVGNRLVRLCCKSCVKTFRADAAGYLRKLSS